MKKTYFWSLFTLLVMGLCSVSLASCGDDDDDNGDNGGSSGGKVTGNIVGTWHSTVSEGWEYRDGVLVSHWKDLDETTTRLYTVANGRETGEYRDMTVNAQWEEVTFNNNGTWTSTNEDDEGSKGRYSLSGDILRVYSDDGYETEMTVKFEGGQMLLTMEEYDDGELESREVIYYDKGSYPRK